MGGCDRYHFLKEFYKSMSEQVLYRIWMIPGGIFLLISGLFFLLLNADNLKRFESLPRNRYFGLIVGWFGLYWCIPHAQAVAPQFLIPLLRPIAVIAPIAAFFSLDYMTSRAFGGLLIILSYEALHRSFALALPLAGVIAVLSWLLGACGIWISGMPYIFRDAIRLAAEKKNYKRLFAFSLLASGLLFIVSGVALI